MQVWENHLKNKNSEQNDRGVKPDEASAWVLE